MYEGSNFSLFASTWYCLFVNQSRSAGYAVESPCVDLHFPNGWWRWAFFHVSVGTFSFQNFVKLSRTGESTWGKALPPHIFRIHLHEQGIYLIPAQAVTLHHGICVCLGTCDKPGLNHSRFYLHLSLACPSPFYVVILLPQPVTGAAPLAFPVHQSRATFVACFQAASLLSLC